MATNPKLPDYPGGSERRRTNEHAKVQMIRQSKFPWPLVALIVGAALIIAIISVLPRAPHVSRTPSAAQVPPQPTNAQIQLTNVRIDPAPAGNAIYLDAVLHNAGSTEITGVQVNGQFFDNTGKSLETEIATVQGVQGGATTTQDLTQAPIRPNDSRPVRIYFDHLPNGWNHQVPQLTVTTVTGTTP